VNDLQIKGYMVMDAFAGVMELMEYIGKKMV
jgi:hypothetical protein